MIQSNSVVESLLARVRAEVASRKEGVPTTTGSIMGGVELRPSAGTGLVHGMDRFGPDAALSWPFTIGLLLVKFDTHAVAVSNNPASVPAYDVATKEIRNFFDGKYYRSQFSSLKLNVSFAYIHYLEVGWRAGISPHPLFQVPWYLTVYPDLLKAQVEPLTHYLSVGWREGRDPNAFFSTEYYLAQVPELRDGDECPLIHYARIGWKEGWDTSPRFSGRHYLARNPDIASRGIEPLSHFLSHGRDAGRSY